MTAGELHDLFRREVADEAAPYLWSSADIFDYLDDAQIRFCQYSLGIPDVRTDEVVRVPVSAGEPYADLHPSILTIREARLASTGRRLTVLNAGDPVVVGNDYGIGRSIDDRSPGAVIGLVVGEEDHLVRWVAVPEADDEVLLAVYRLPLAPITQRSQGFEIRAEHVRALLDWMKARAYRKTDAETLNLAKAVEHEQAFRRYCEQAMSQQERYQHKARTVAYGGL